MCQRWSKSLFNPLWGKILNGGWGACSRDVGWTADKNPLGWARCTPWLLSISRARLAFRGAESRPIDLQTESDRCRQSACFFFNIAHGGYFLHCTQLYLVLPRSAMLYLMEDCHRLPLVALALVLAFLRAASAYTGLNAQKLYRVIQKEWQK